MSKFLLKTLLKNQDVSQLVEQSGLSRRRLEELAEGALDLTTAEAISLAKALKSDPAKIMQAQVDAELAVLGYQGTVATKTPKKAATAASKSSQSSAVGRRPADSLSSTNMKIG